MALADDVGDNLFPSAKYEYGAITDLTYDIEKALADRVADNRADIDSSNGKQRRRIIWLIVVFRVHMYKKMEVVRGCEAPPFFALPPLSRAQREREREISLQILVTVTLFLQEDLGVLSY